MNAIAQVPPKPVQIRDALAGRIARGELTAGGRLPPVRVIAAEFGVSVTTAGEAVKLLAAEKLVRVRGRRLGTVVAGPEDEAEVLAPRLVFGPQERFGWGGAVPGEQVEVVAAETGFVDARGPYGYVADILRLEAAPRNGVVPVYRRTQLARDRAGVPVRLEVSWFRSSWVELVRGEDGGLPLASLDRAVSSLGGVAWLIHRQSGWPVVAGTHWVEARAARDDGRETTLMGLAAGAPLLAATYDWLARDGEGEVVVVEYGEYILMPGQVVQHRYVVTLASLRRAG